MCSKALQLCKGMYSRPFVMKILYLKIDRNIYDCQSCCIHFFFQSEEINILIKPTKITLRFFAIMENVILLLQWFPGKYISMNEIRKEKYI